MKMFKIVSGNVYLCDPCYISESDDDATQYQQKAKNGIWNVTVDCMETSHDYRIESFTASHNDINFSDTIVKTKSYGVDSGQFGIFDSSIDLSTVFYKECCKLTLSKFSYGVLNNQLGFVSSTGYGDGEYNLTMWVDKNTDEIVQINIEFIEKYDSLYEDEELYSEMADDLYETEHN